MKELNKKILDMIYSHKSLNEIIETCNLENKTVYRKINKLKEKGFLIDHKLIDNGDIVYYLKTDVYKDYSNTINLKLSDSNRFKCAVISDTHFGSGLDNLKYLDEVYNHCIDNDLHIIIHAGDLIDGNFGDFERAIPIISDQIDYTIKNYPYCDNILNLICLGNHDYTSLKEYLDIKNVLKNSRSDLIPFGFGVGILNVLNDQIIIKHKINSLIFSDTPCNITLIGHYHKMKFINSEGDLSLFLPSLSDMQFNNELPGFLTLDFIFGNGKILYCHADNYVIKNGLYKVSEFENDFIPNERFIDEVDIVKKKRLI